MATSHVAPPALALALAGFMICAWHAPIEAVPPPARTEFAETAIARGANLAAIGNCSGCHTRPDTAPFSGGLALQSPFGTIYSSNITPDASRGIGQWSQVAFVRSMREGVSRDGHLLYPAFPYDHFTRSTDEDLAALYAYVMTRAPVDTATPPNEMRFPFGVRPLIAGWNLLFLDRHPFEPDAGKSAEWNRGAYLADALAHCSACHSPRNALGAERRGEAFAGGTPEGWYAPPLNTDSPSPQPWTAQALAEYLRTGITPRHAIAGGPMQGVTAGLANASEADVQAIADYVMALMGTPSDARQQRAAAALARAENPLPSSPASDDPQLVLGAIVYAGACASCHDLGRRTSSNGALRLPLAIAVHDADPHSLLRIVREGITPPPATPGRMMPAFGTALTDEQLTALAAYLRHAAAGAPPWPDLARVVRETRDPAATKEPS
jgi:mono/diheme cytochrome c family protein